MNKPNQLRMTVYAALFVALIAIGAFIHIPIGPIPIVLQNMFVLLAGIILGPVWGLACVAIYLFIGICGLPVFSGGHSGIGWILGPTGGYLIAYLPAVVATASISKILGQKFSGNVIAMVAGSVIIYALGVPWLKFAFSMTWTKAFAAGMYPFIIGDCVKVIAAAMIARMLKPVVTLQPQNKTA
ncbi:MAG: biotin transporter BioY [Desulfobacteraceae bacterium]|nr:biotin transporter BioY [Desulfobacteraceae bacterium]